MFWAEREVTISSELTKRGSNKILFSEILTRPSSPRVQSGRRFIFPRGFSSNIAFLAWAITSGFLLEFWETILLSSKFKPEFGEFVDTRMDLINQNMTLVLFPDQQSLIDVMIDSPVEEYNKLAKITLSLGK